MSELWVCSKWNTEPKDEEKWKVLGEYDHGYKVAVPKPLAIGTESWFPKSDYVPCPAPEQWERVEVALSAPDAMSYQDIIVGGENVGILRLHKPYRVVSLVVERRKG